MNITDYHAAFGLLAGVLIAAGMLPYVWSIVKTKETSPNRASWLIWSVIGAVNLCAYVSAGERETIWMALMAAVNPIIIFVLSLKYGERTWYRSDTTCIILAIVAIVTWRVTGNPVLALAMGILADVLGLIPTCLKLVKDPESENLLAWAAVLVASICNVVAVKEWTLANGMYVGYCISSSGVVVGQIVLGRRVVASR